MAVKVGSARSSFGNTAPGDQAGGKEVSTQDWYLHSKGWYVYRARDPEQREKIALAMEKACANDDIGYSQPTRDMLWNDVKASGYDPSKTTKKVNTDCSALVRVCCAYAGIVLNDFITSTEGTRLLNSGKFDRLSDDKHCKRSDYLRRGDILCTRTKGHTVVVLSDGSKTKAENKTSKPAASDGKTVEITGSTVNIRSGPGTDYAKLGVAKKAESYAVSEAQTWIPIVYNGGIGWVSSKYAKRV